MSTLTLSTIRQNLSKFNFNDLSIPALVLIIMGMLVIPLPPMLLDVLFTFNIATAVLIIMIAIKVRKPLEFSSFPSVLLFATMLRLALNVASTRVILVNGHEGHEAAGKVVAAFGEFVIGGNYVVGFIIFAILMIVNFFVVTKGAGRVSEVNARFTLDAMPGKQMAIDADLNAGVIDQDTARQRRAELGQESDFFGSMDGASKFVSGDAMAGLLILIIHLVGGLAIGIGQHGLSLSEAGRIYSLLTIGDGLVAQIPSLLLSLATAIVVTRVTTTESMTEQASSQLGNPAALFVTSSIMAMLGLVPGMPHVVFIVLSAAAAGAGWMLLRREAAKNSPEEVAAAAAVAASEQPKELDWEDLDQVDLVGLEIGYGLIPLVNAETGGQLMTRVKGVRKKLSAELGFLIQPVRIRDALSIDPDSYQIVLKGVVRGRGKIKVGREMAINPGQVYGNLEGTPTTEPAFGLDAVWIEPSQRDHARSMGYTVVDAATAIATHLNKVLRENSSDLLSHDEVQQLLDKLTAKSPKLVEDLVPSKLSLGVLTRTLQGLLNDSVSIRDMRTIAPAPGPHDCAKPARRQRNAFCHDPGPRSGAAAAQRVAAAKPGPKRGHRARPGRAPVFRAARWHQSGRRPGPRRRSGRLARDSPLAVQSRTPPRERVVRPVLRRDSGRPVGQSHSHRARRTQRGLAITGRVSWQPLSNYPERHPPWNSNEFWPMTPRVPPKKPWPCMGATCWSFPTTA